MTAYAVGVAVGQLFCGRITHLDNLDREDQGFTGQRVIRVDIDVFQALSLIHI